MNTAQRRALTLLWNASSGWTDSDQVRASVESILASDGTRVEICQVEKGMDIPGKSKAISSRGADVLVAAGGDGTINAAASALIGKSTALGVIPAGTLNHFARDLQIPIDPEKAAQSLVEGRVVQVDAAAVNGRVFLNNSVLGLFPNYRTVREAWERKGFGRSSLGRLIAFTAAVLKIFWRLPHLTISLSLEGGRTRTLRTPFVLVGNNEHRMEGIGLGIRERLDQGQLWVYAMRPCTRWQLLRMVFGLVLGRTPRESIFEIFPVSQMTVHSRRARIGVGIDGEMVRMKSPLVFKTLPLALHVIAPPEYQSIDVPRS